MNIVVCIRRLSNGELNPFDACAYEAALRLLGDITLVSMGPMSVKPFIEGLTRLGAKRAILVSDAAFAGADTLATAYTLSLAIKKLSPDVIFCGRQAIDGDTGQVGPELCELLGVNFSANVQSIKCEKGKIYTQSAFESEHELVLPALITIERINTLRLPSIRSKIIPAEVFSADDIGADLSKIGLKGSPTRVIKTFENTSGKRKCKFITMSELDAVIEESVRASREIKTDENISEKKLKSVLIVGEAVRKYAESVCDNIKVLPISNADAVVFEIENNDFDAVLFGSDPLSKEIGARVAARLKLGLCADCTRLEASDTEMIMYRPALAGSLIAKIKSLTRPALATVRTSDSDVPDVIVGAGYGVKDKLEEVRAFAKSKNAAFAASRKLVDNSYAAYSEQVGLTGRTVSPPVYIAIGISGVVHHIVGIERSGTVIAINPDRNAPIFDYADYGIVDEF